jgi:glycosyltransferase involved in cell wall biosynthesis
MKILITIFEIQDYGGIVGDIELMIRGLQDHGHECKLIMLRNIDRDPYVRRDTVRQGSYESITGGQVNTLSGWYGIEVHGYGSGRRLKQWKALTDEYDLVIHEIPGPKPDVKDHWLKLYDINTPQIIVAHDANFREMYPHVALVADKINGIACTNHAGYVALEWFPAPRAFIGAAHKVLNRKIQTPWRDRMDTAVCAHVWKAWKHMDQVVRAAPYIQEYGYHLVMGGDGIEGRYMRSKDKCKERYKGIWKRAMRSGMEYRGLMTHSELFKVYRSAKVMIDMSWSKKFMALGNHFNRSIIESYNNGVVPICVRENMEDAVKAQVTLWKEDGPKKNYVAVGNDCSPELLADTVSEVMKMHPDDAEQIILNGRKILKRYFDYRTTSLEFLKLAEGKPAGVYPKLEIGKMPNGFEEKIDAYLHSNAQ